MSSIEVVSVSSAVSSAAMIVSSQLSNCAQVRMVSYTKLLTRGAATGMGASKRPGDALVLPPRGAAAPPFAAACCASNDLARPLKPYFSQNTLRAPVSCAPIAIESIAGRSGTQSAKSQSVLIVSSDRPVGSQSKAWRKFSPTTPLMLAALSTTACSEPYSCSHFTAVLGPTLATPGTLSTVSPTSVW